MLDPTEFLFDLPCRAKPESEELLQKIYPGVQSTWKKSSSCRVVNPILGIKTIVLHSTNSMTTDQAMSCLKGGNLSWHWLISEPNEYSHGRFAWACIPQALAARHVHPSSSHPAVNNGAKWINRTSLSIEIINSTYGAFDDPYSEWQVRIAADIVRYCWYKYPNINQVVSHAVLDPTRRSDPGKHFPWNLFRDMVLSVEANKPLKTVKHLDELDPSH